MASHLDNHDGYVEAVKFSLEDLQSFAVEFWDAKSGPKTNCGTHLLVLLPLR